MTRPSLASLSFLSSWLCGMAIALLLVSGCSREATPADASETSASAQHSSNDAPAREAFMLIEPDYAAWSAIAVQGDAQAQVETIEALFEGMKALSARYEAVGTHGSRQWTVAAVYRVGELLDRFAHKLHAAPSPFAVGSESYQLYQVQRFDLILPLATNALTVYDALLAQSAEGAGAAEIEWRGKATASRQALQSALTAWRTELEQMKLDVEPVPEVP